MRLIRFFFWMVTTIIVAYFLTDIHIAGKTLKQHIDGFLASQTGQELKSKAGNVLDNLEKLTEPAKPGGAGKSDKTEKSDRSDLSDKSDAARSDKPKEPEVTRSDEQELKKIIKTNQ